MQNVFEPEFDFDFMYSGQLGIPVAIISRDKASAIHSEDPIVGSSGHNSE
jgi:hypothetical protein